MIFRIFQGYENVQNQYGGLRDIDYDTKGNRSSSTAIGNKMKLLPVSNVGISGFIMA